MFDGIFEHVAGRVSGGLKDFGYIFWLDFSTSECLLPSLSFGDRSSVEDISRNRGQNGTKLPKNDHKETTNR